MTRLVLLVAVAGAMVFGCSSATRETQNGETDPSTVATADDSGAASGTPGADGGTAAGPGQLVDATTDLGVDEALVGVRGHAVATADVNDDGWADLFVGTFADRPIDSYQVRGASGPAPDRLLLGSPEGFVVDAGFEGRLGRSAGATFDDLDGDGDVDLVVSRNVREGERSRAPSEIYRNDDGELVPASVLDDHRGGRAVVTIDYNLDGRRDILLVEDRWSGASTGLFRNDGDLTFTEVTGEVGFPVGVFGLGAAVGDLNGDGVDDVVIGGSNRWFLGDGEGFTEGPEALQWELHGDEDDPAQVVLSDTNADGRLDVLIGQHFNSTLDSQRPEPVRLFLNDGNDDSGQPRFVDVTAAAGLPALATKSPQLLLVDLTGDGHNDIVTTASEAGNDEQLPLVITSHGVQNGQPTFTPPDGVAGSHYWIDGVTIDANGDHRPDVFFVEWEPALGSRLFLNVALDQ